MVYLLFTFHDGGKERTQRRLLFWKESPQRPVSSRKQSSFPVTLSELLQGAGVCSGYWDTALSEIDTGPSNVHLTVQWRRPYSNHVDQEKWNCHYSPTTRRIQVWCKSFHPIKSKENFLSCVGVDQAKKSVSCRRKSLDTGARAKGRGWVMFSCVIHHPQTQQLTQPFSP